MLKGKKKLRLLNAYSKNKSIKENKRKWRATFLEYYHSYLQSLIYEIYNLAKSFLICYHFFCKISIFWLRKIFAFCSFFFKKKSRKKSFNVYSRSVAQINHSNQWKDFQFFFFLNWLWKWFGFRISNRSFGYHK